MTVLSGNNWRAHNSPVAMDIAWRAERALVPPATRRAVAVVPSVNIKHELKLAPFTVIIYPAEPRAVSVVGEAPGDRWMRDSR